jgi:hypothetical protein
MNSPLREVNYVDIKYFMDINYFKNLISYTNLTFPSFEIYRKTDFLNRCRIAGANGPILLTVPLEKGRNQRTVLKEVKICNEEKWQLRQWKAIRSSYNGSPWFGYYADDLSGLFSKRFDLLVDWNTACFQWVADKFGLNFKIALLENEPPQEQSLVITDLRNRSETMSRTGQPVIRYVQVFENKTGFIPNLSVLDLLFCQGPKTGLQLLG